MTIRFDSGFWSNDTITTLNRLNVRYTMAVRCSSKGINDAITAIPDDAWEPIEYTDDGEAAVAECDYTTGAGKRAVTRRLIVRRTRLTDKQQLKLWPDWRHFGFLTDLEGTAIDIDRFRRQHAVVELAIRDLKQGAGLEHIPSGNFHANSAWLQCAVLAHNMIRWTAIAGRVRVDNQLIVARTLRTRLLAIQGRLVNRAGRPTLRMPTNRPWATLFTTALDTLRDSIPPPADQRSCGPAHRQRNRALTTHRRTRPYITAPDTNPAHQPAVIDPAAPAIPSAQAPLGGSRLSSPDVDLDDVTEATEILGEQDVHSTAESRAERGWWFVLTLAAVLAGAAMRLFDLVGVPGEMYGDIAIVHEYVESIRHHEWPTYFTLSSGPLYHYLIMPIVWIVGAGFTSLKIASVVISALVLAATFGLARQLLDRRLAVTSLFIAGVSSWLLVFSRLGNSQIITPLLATGAMYFVVRLVRSDRRWNAAACGVVSATGLYGYPQTFILAPSLLVVLLTMHWTAARVRWRDLQIFCTAAVVAALPFIVLAVRHPQNFLDGYIGGKIHSSSSTISTLGGNAWRALLALHVTGDEVFRSNPVRLPHLDTLSGLLFAIGVVFWLAPKHRQWAPVVLLPLVLFQIPSIMVLSSTREVPSASRTVLVAPLVYIVTASGLCWLAAAVHRTQLVQRVVVATLLFLILVLNGQRYFEAYADGLPDRNVPFGRIIADYFGQLPQATNAFTIGCCWSDWGQPQPKGITYLETNQVATDMLEISPDTFDCAALAALPRPAVLVWSPANALPSPAIGPCADQLSPMRHVVDGFQVFNSSLVAAGGTG